MLARKNQQEQTQKGKTKNVLPSVLPRSLLLIALVQFPKESVALPKQPHTYNKSREVDVSFGLLWSAPGCPCLLLAAPGCSGLHLAALVCSWLLPAALGSLAALPGCLHSLLLTGVLASGPLWWFLLS